MGKKGEASIVKALGLAKAIEVMVVVNQVRVAQLEADLVDPAWVVYRRQIADDLEQAQKSLDEAREISFKFHRKQEKQQQKLEEKIKKRMRKLRESARR